MHDDGPKFTPGAREVFIILVVLAVGYFWLVPHLFR